MHYGKINPVLWNETLLSLTSLSEAWKCFWLFKKSTNGRRKKPLNFSSLSFVFWAWIIVATSPPLSSVFPEMGKEGKGNLEAFAERTQECFRLILLMSGLKCFPKAVKYGLSTFCLSPFFVTCPPSPQRSSWIWIYGCFSSPAPFHNAQIWARAGAKKR